MTRIPEPLIIFDRALDMRVLNPCPERGFYPRYVREETYAVLKREMGDQRTRREILDELYAEAKRVDADIARLTEAERRRIDERLAATECPACKRAQPRAAYSKTQWRHMKEKQAFRCITCSGSSSSSNRQTHAPT